MVVWNSCPKWHKVKLVKLNKHLLQFLTGPWKQFFPLDFTLISLFNNETSPIAHDQVDHIIFSSLNIIREFFLGFHFNGFQNLVRYYHSQNMIKEKQSCSTILLSVAIKDLRLLTIRWARSLFLSLFSLPTISLSQAEMKSFWYDVRWHEKFRRKIGRKYFFTIIRISTSKTNSLLGYPFFK